MTCKPSHQGNQVDIKNKKKRLYLKIITENIVVKHFTLQKKKSANKRAL